MTHIDTPIQQFIHPRCRVHLVGVGGVSMAPLAEVLHSAGLIVSGSDWNENENTTHLRQLGIQVHVGPQCAEHIQGAECVIRTAAAHDDNPEIAAAHEQGIPVFERAEAWGAIMQHYENAVCISGTHGKTTTTSMATHIFMAAQADPTVMIGGTLPLIRSSLRVGKGKTIIMESCEYCNSFHYFFPTVAVVLNVEADHLDFFKDLDDIKASFRKFADLVPENGFVVLNADDPGAVSAMEGCEKPVFTFGIYSDKANCKAENIVLTHGLPAFDIVVNGQHYAHVELLVGGDHNISNALAAASAAYLLGIPGAAVSAGLATFTGAGRRFEYKGSYNGAKIYDDYAHHPAELHALLRMARKLGYERVICAFQPHTFTRTKALFQDFVRELQQADVVLLAEIFAAREKNTIGISSTDLAREIPGAVFCKELSAVTEELKKLARPGDLILTVGAGNIYTVGESLAALEEKK